MSRQDGIHYDRQTVAAILETTVCQKDDAEKLADILETFTFDMLDDLHRVLRMLKAGPR